MRLRKIGLGNPHKRTNGYSGLFFPNCEMTQIYLPNALGMFLDKVTPEEEKAVKEHFKQNYRFPSSAVLELPDGKISSYLFADYSSSVADANGDRINSLGAQNRNALLVVTPKVISDIHHCSYVEVGGYKGYFMEAPTVRGSVPNFEGTCTYIEIANGEEEGSWSHSDPALSILEKVITEFETPVHERVFREILAGTRKEFTTSALYRHLHETGQTKKW